VKRLATMLVAAVLCTGCVGSLLESNVEARRFTGSRVLACRDRGDPLPLALAVAPPRAAASLDTERIAVVQPDSRFDYFSGVRGRSLRRRCCSSAGGARWRPTAVRHRGGGAEPVFPRTHARTSSCAASRLSIRRRRGAARQRGDAGHARGRSQGAATAELRGAARSRGRRYRRTAVLESFERATAEALQETVVRLRELRPACSAEQAVE